MSTHVKPGQVWQCMDNRESGNRTLRVESVGGDVMDPVAVCTVLTATDYFGNPSAAIGQRRRIRVRRMKPGSRGYRLIEDVEEA